MNTKKYLAGLATLAMVANVAVAGIAMADGSASGEAIIDSGTDSLSLIPNYNLNSPGGTLTFEMEEGTDCNGGNASFNTSSQEVCAHLIYQIDGYDTDSDETQAVSLRLLNTENAGTFTSTNTNASHIPFTAGGVVHSTFEGISTWSAYNSQTAGAFGTFSETAINTFDDNAAATIAQFVEDQSNFAWYTLQDKVNLTLNVPAGQPSGVYNDASITVALISS